MQKNLINQKSEEKDLERLKEAVYKSDAEKFYTLTALMKRQLLLNRMKITYKKH
ncbi:MAG: hypothetical protein SFY32_09470 [Bacteroidota bacterium]|nr:hypothetical protein [Bacteroidota bacterium]